MVSREELMNHSFVWLTLKHTWGKVHRILETSAEVEVGNTVEMVAFNHMNIIQNELEPGDRVMVADLQKHGTVLKLHTPYFVGGANAVRLIVDGVCVERSYSQLERILEITEVCQQDRLKDYCDSIYANEKPDDPMDRQVGGKHYTRFAIQPLEFIHKNRLNFMQGNIIKYTVRYPFKNGVEDLEKARDYLDKLIACERHHVK